MKEKKTAMKGKKTASHLSPVRVASNGVVKKKNKNKKKKEVVKNLSSSAELKGAVLAASGLPNVAVSPKDKKKKKNKNKEQKSVEDREDTNSIQQKHSDRLVEGDSPIKKKGVKNALKDKSAIPILLKKNEEKTGKKTKRTKSGQAKEGKPEESNEARERRTIFVGNVSTKTTRKSLARFFSKYGKVETVRLRSAAVAAPKTTKKIAIITNTYHEKRSSLNAYVRFKEEVMVEAALQANGAELDQKHLHVDRSQAPTQKNTKLAVFVGNLAFEAEEEELRSHFASCGEIDSVRIVRDKKLASGKGFGYVNFKSEDAVEMALQQDGQVFMHRQLRVQRCSKQGKKLSKPKLKTKGKKGLAFMKSKNVPVTKKSQSFSGKKMMENKKFKKMKAKARLSKEDRKKKAIAHKLTGSASKAKVD